MEIVRIGENTTHEKNFFVDRPNGHNVYLFLITRTKAKFFYNNQWIIAEPGSAVLFMPGQKHLYGPVDNAPDFPAYADDWMHLNMKQITMPEQFPFGKPIPLRRSTEFFNLLHLIHEEFYGNSPHKNSVMEHLAEALFYKLLDEGHMLNYPALYYELIKLREDIYRNPEKSWNIPEICSALNISSGYFYNQYKRFFQTTCIQDVIKSRIEMACDLLLSRQLSVEEVGEFCGYQNTEHFIRQFKSETGTTPFKYKQHDQAMTDDSTE